MLRSTLLLAPLFALAAGCASSQANVATTPVEKLDVERYLGTWFEIAKFPQPFQAGCLCTTATYELADDGDIRVVNRCRKGSPSGDVDTAQGRAWRPAPQEEPGKLRVSFFWPFAGDYWVIERGEPDDDGRYPWAMVSNDDGSTLWILSRTPQMDAPTYERLLSRLREQGFDLSRLDETVQTGCWERDGGRVAEQGAAP